MVKNEVTTESGERASSIAPARKQVSFKLIAALVLSGFVLLAVFLGVSPARQFDGLEIKGTARFQGKVADALALLREKSPSAYQVVTNHVRVIKQSRRSGMRLDLAQPTFELANPTAYYSITWCASAIAHDSMHSKIHHDQLKTNPGGQRPDDWPAQVAEEQQCNAHQLQVLRELAAPAHEINHCAEQDGTHADVNKDGKYDWDDYEQGNW